MYVRVGLFCSVIVVASVSTGCSGTTKEQILARVNSTAPRISVALAPAIESDVATDIELVGSLIAKRRSVIVSDVDAVIREIPASAHESIEGVIDGQQVFDRPRLNFGVRVAKGDVLVQLESTEFELRLKAAQAHLNTAIRQAEHLKAWRRDEEIRQKEAERDEAAARLKLAELNLKRTQGLIERKAVTRATLDQTETDRETARAVLERAEAELTIAQAGPTKEEIAVVVAAVEEAQAAVAQAQWRLDRATIRAPYDGVVTERFVDEGDRVTAMPRVEIMELMDLSVLTAELSVPEKYINQLQVGDAADVFVKGRAESVRGMVVLVNDKVDSANRSFRIRVGIRNEDRQFKVGQFVRVALEIDSVASTVTVPVDAITYVGGEAQVFVCANDRVAQRKVQIGLGNETTVQVLSGLRVGEQVVIDDPSILANGMAVQVRATEPTTKMTANL